MSLAHAGVQTYYAGPYAWHVVEWMWDGGELHEPVNYHFCMALFLLYTLFDSCVHWHKLGSAYRTHHVLTVVGCLQNVIRGPHFVGMCVLANETSTIFLSTKALLSKQNPCRKYCRYAFGITFFLCRVCLNALCFSYTLERCHWDTCVLMAGIVALNGYWFVHAMVRATSKR